MENDNIISLLTTDFWTLRRNPLIKFETRRCDDPDNDGRHLEKTSIARTVAHYIIGGEIIREYRPSMIILNNKTAIILQFKRKDKNDDTSERREEGTDL